MTTAEKLKKAEQKVKRLEAQVRGLQRSGAYLKESYGKLEMIRGREREAMKAEAEYEKILAKWGVFHSAHEEMESLREDMKALWGKIREDAEDEAAGIAEEIYNDAMKCAAELMQVGAVCLRFINSNGKDWGR